MPDAHPSVVVLSGPNGAGKSTMAARLLVGALRVSEYADADVFARSLPRSEATAVTAGRAVLRRLDELLWSGGVSVLRRRSQASLSVRESAG